MAAWAPLLLAETRAQLLQEFCMQTLGKGILCRVEPATTQNSRQRPGRNAADYWLLEDENTAGQVVVHAKTRADITIQTNDLCLLIAPAYATILQDIYNNNHTNADFHSHAALVGQAITTRAGLNGLVLQVSKRKWAKLGTKEMYFYKLGGNVTALREFTALCSMERIPMKRFLLGQHLEQEEHRRKLSSKQAPEQLFQKMGGTSALGKGFLDYASAKFNSSQLAAIAASAHQYGEGGFTLIKGPPGTGKTVSDDPDYTTCTNDNGLINLYQSLNTLVADDPRCSAQLVAHSSIQQVLRRSASHSSATDWSASIGSRTRAKGQTTFAYMRTFQCSD
jgi:hypothetical protein